MQITIKQVAQRAGVSVATVSRVINNSKKVNPKTCKKTLDIIKELNYKPNNIARSLVSGKTHTLLLFIPPDQNFVNADYFHKLISGISTVTTQKEYNLLIRQQNVDEKFQNNLLDFPVDGFIIAAPALDSIIVKQLEVTQKPAVIINSRSPYLNWIDLDNIFASSLLMKHLFKLGHKKIAFIGGLGNGQNSQDRLKGYQLALAKHGIVFNPDLVFYAGYEKTKAYELTKNIILNKTDITAIFACNDFMAIGAINAIKEKGLKVPQDIAVVGFDDIDIAESFDPPITTIRQPFIEMGKKAVELLIARIKNKSGEEKIKNIELQGKLIVRKSCGLWDKNTGK